MFLQFWIIIIMTSFNVFFLKTKPLNVNIQQSSDFVDSLSWKSKMIYSSNVYIDLLSDIVFVIKTRVELFTLMK